MKDSQRVVRGTVLGTHDSKRVLLNEHVPNRTEVAVLPIDKATGAVGPVEPWMVEWLTIYQTSLARGDVDRGSFSQIATALAEILGGQDG